MPSPCLGGGTGRHRRLKISRPLKAVWVRVPPSLPKGIYYEYSTNSGTNYTALTMYCFLPFVGSNNTYGEFTFPRYFLEFPPLKNNPDELKKFAKEMGYDEAEIALILEAASQ